MGEHVAVSPHRQMTAGMQLRIRGRGGRLMNILMRFMCVYICWSIRRRTLNCSNFADVRRGFAKFISHSECLCVWIIIQINH